ncbi:MAG: hypothetical protein NVSMB68_13960 [Thermoanaerobaculia bacterium]
MRKATVLLAVILLAGCGSVGLGDLGSIFGSQSQSNPSNISGVVTDIDTGAHRIDVNVTYVNQLRPNSSQSSGSIYYDSNTRVVYQGNNYNVTDLERGDEISVSGYNNNGRYMAQTITVTRNSRRR